MYQASRLTNIFQEFSIPLILGVLAGLATANIDPSFYEELVDFHLFGETAKVLGHPLTVHFLINEVFMVLFFGIAAKEITDSVLPGGALNPPNKAINPLMATIGGILGPVGVYFLLTALFYGGTENFSEVANGWGIPTATDIALAGLVARVVFGSHHSAVNFLLLLAVADDAIGLGIIAVFYPDPNHPVEPIWLLLTLAGIAATYGLRRMHVGLWPLYVLIGGGLSWSGLALSGVEPALALVVIVPFLPGPRIDPVMVRSHAEDHPAPQPPESSGHHAGHGISPLDQFEHQLKLFVDLGLFFFAFANAGVAFGSINSVNADNPGVPDSGQDDWSVAVLMGRHTPRISITSRHGVQAPGRHRANCRAGTDSGAVRRRKGIPGRLGIPRPGQDGGGSERGRSRFGHWHWPGAEAERLRRGKPSSRGARRRVVYGARCGC